MPSQYGINNVSFVGKLTTVSVLSNDIVIRPRFQSEFKQPKEELLKFWGVASDPVFKIKVLDDHVFITFSDKHRDIWSPQLHLEMEALTDSTTKIHGVFGPNPTLWTFFMFLHFGIATLFIVLGIWAYSNFSLQKPYGMQLSLMGLMMAFWIAFYIFGRMGRHKRKPQMRQLHVYMREILGKSDR